MDLSLDGIRTGAPNSERPAAAPAANPARVFPVLFVNLAVHRESDMSRPRLPMRQSYAIQENIVLPGDTNAHDTLFGGLLMKHIDETAAISARRHSRGSVVTASNDGVHFHRPIQRDDIVRLQSYVCSVGTTSMEVFVKITTENSLDGARHVAAISFLTFVSLDGAGRPAPVPEVFPESDEENLVYNERTQRREARLRKRDETNQLIQSLTALSAIGPDPASPSIP
jgi:acyl-CoA hydrolase